MDVSLDWLREYCDFKLSPEELARLLPELGLQVEGERKVGSDTVLVLEITANRPDLLSMIGVAREVAAATGTALRMPDAPLRCGGGQVDARTSVALEAPDLCPRYTARLITGVRIGPSPDWLQKRLEAAGLRPVNNVVDITNFVLMECGQPLHAFDFDKLRGARIVVRRARPAEPITAIDGSVHKLGPEMLVIADAEVPTAVAGVMGGLETEISEKTTSVLLESAQFLPASIRRTSRALGLSSDSSYRFERGIDPKGVDWGSVRAAAMIAELAGGLVLEGVIDVGQPPPKESIVTFRPARACAVLGVEIPAKRQKELLQGLGFEAAGEREGEIDFRVPTFRQEVRREIDLIEEIARTYGYSSIPQETRMRVRAVPMQKVDEVSQKARDLCTGLGYMEVRTSSFSPVEPARRFTHWVPEAAIIRNPVNREEPALRTSLIPQLLRVKKTNLNRGVVQPAIFELSKIYGSVSGKPAEKTCLTLLDDGGFASVRGAVDTLAARLGVEQPVQYVEHADPNFAPGRLARLTLGGRTLGFAGEVSSELAAVFDLAETPAAAELDFDLLVEAARLDRRFRPLPRFPAVRRDLCVIVGDSAKWADIQAAAAGEAGPAAESLAFQSEYRGEQIPRGKKALAFSVTFRAPDRTLTGEEADEAMARIAATMEKQFGARLRA